jgi:hypothetical protein
VITRLSSPLIHGSWANSWWLGDRSLSELFGPPPTLETLADLASRLRGEPGWTSTLVDTESKPVPEDALVVLAGQQPVLGGGPALVAHKAATAIALANQLSATWNRPVVPLFLLATQDHDSTEVDHLDLVNPRSGQLERHRCPIHPQSEMFWRARWDSSALDRFETLMRGRLRYFESFATQADQPGLSGHVIGLLDETFGPLGLRIVEAHRLSPAGQPILEAALEEHQLMAEALRQGATALRKVGLAPSFDPEDPRPLVLESRAHRRRRLQPNDPGAVQRMADHPEDFSPHAALRPIVQAAALPVVAQVCGPSEIIYLAQARGLHALASVQPPLLVPRLEATWVHPEQLSSLGPDLRPRSDRPVTNRSLEDLIAASQAFVAKTRQVDASQTARLERFALRIERTARSLAEAPLWKGRGRGDETRLRPRGRFQDSVLGWLPQAFGSVHPARWGEYITELCEPLAAPRHVLHVGPQETP